MYACPAWQWSRVPDVAARGDVDQVAIDWEAIKAKIAQEKERERGSSFK